MGLGQLTSPKARGDFLFRTYYDEGLGRVMVDSSSVEFHSAEDGFTLVYSPPEPGHEYVIGGDTAGDGSDYFVAQVVQADSGRQVCMLRGRMDEDLYAKQVYCLGLWYNEATVAIESNFSGYPMRELQQLGYPNQYSRPDGAGCSYGFRTTAATRPLILAGLVETVREHPEWLSDRETVRELLTFVRSPSGRPQAQPGSHDDCVMALAIAHHVRGSTLDRDQRAYIDLTHL